MQAMQAGHGGGERGDAGMRERDSQARSWGTWVSKDGCQGEDIPQQAERRGEKGREEGEGRKLCSVWESPEDEL